MCVCDALGRQEIFAAGGFSAFPDAITTPRSAGRAPPGRADDIIINEISPDARRSSRRNNLPDVTNGSLQISLPVRGTMFRGIIRQGSDDDGAVGVTRGATGLPGSPGAECARFGRPQFAAIAVIGTGAGRRRPFYWAP